MSRHLAYEQNFENRPLQDTRKAKTESKNGTLNITLIESVFEDMKI